MKSKVQTRHVTFSILSVTLAGGAVGLSAYGCSTTAVTVTDGGSSSSSSGGSSSSGSGAGSSSSSGGSSGSSSSGGPLGGGCFGSAGTCTPVGPAPLVTDFETYTPTTADGGFNDPNNFTYYVNAQPPDPSAVLGGLLFISDGDGAPTLSMIPGYMSNYAAQIATTSTVFDGGTTDFGGFLLFYFISQSTPEAGAGTVSPCLNPANYSGLSFWAQGTTGALPPMNMGVSLQTVETTPTASGGLCDATADAAACAYPTARVTLPATWTRFQLPWSQFTGGITSMPGACALPPGSGIIRIEMQPFDLYAPPAFQISPQPYTLDVDDVTFY